MQRFKEIFEGNNSAFGQLILSGKKDTRGKEKGRPWIRREKISDELTALTEPPYNTGISKISNFFFMVSFILK